MGKYGFKDIYPNATVLDNDFLKNECGFELDMLEQFERNAVYRNYYLFICGEIKKLHFLRPAPKVIEILLDNPFPRTCIDGWDFCWSSCTKRGLFTQIIDSNERKYMFLCATADQIIADSAKGRESLLANGNDDRSLSSDAKNKLDMLGFCQRTYATK